MKSLFVLKKIVLVMSIVLCTQGFSESYETGESESSKKQEQVTCGEAGGLFSGIASAWSSVGSFFTNLAQMNCQEYLDLNRSIDDMDIGKMCTCISQDTFQENYSKQLSSSKGLEGVYKEVIEEKKKKKALALKALVGRAKEVQDYIKNNKIVSTKSTKELNCGTAQLIIAFKTSAKGGNECRDKDMRALLSRIAPDNIGAAGSSPEKHLKSTLDSCQNYPCSRSGPNFHSYLDNKKSNFLSFLDNESSSLTSYEVFKKEATTIFSGYYNKMKKNELSDEESLEIRNKFKELALNIPVLKYSNSFSEEVTNVNLTKSDVSEKPLDIIIKKIFSKETVGEVLDSGRIEEIVSNSLDDIAKNTFAGTINTCGTFIPNQLAQQCLLESNKDISNYVQGGEEELSKLISEKERGDLGKISDLNAKIERRVQSLGDRCLVKGRTSVRVQTVAEMGRKINQVTDAVIIERNGDPDKYIPRAIVQVESDPTKIVHNALKKVVNSSGGSFVKYSSSKTNEDSPKEDGSSYSRTGTTSSVAANKGTTFNENTTNTSRDNVVDGPFLPFIDSGASAEKAKGKGFFPRRVNRFNSAVFGKEEKAEESSSTGNINEVSQNQQTATVVKNDKDNDELSELRKKLEEVSGQLEKVNKKLKKTEEEKLLEQLLAKKKESLEKKKKLAEAAASVVNSTKESNFSVKQTPKARPTASASTREVAPQGRAGEYSNNPYAISASTAEAVSEGGTTLYLSSTDKESNETLRSLALEEAKKKFESFQFKVRGRSEVVIVNGVIFSRELGSLGVDNITISDDHDALAEVQGFVESQVGQTVGQGKEASQKRSPASAPPSRDLTRLRELIETANGVMGIRKK